jgi:hypothetical protein
MYCRILVGLSVAGMLVVTSAFAANTNQPKGSGQGQTLPASQAPAAMAPSQEQLIYNNTADLLKQVAALVKQVDALTAAQTQQTAQLKDMGRRLYGMCVMEQVLLGFDWSKTADGLSDYALCTQAGFSSLATSIFYSNSSNFDTPFGGQ